MSPKPSQEQQEFLDQIRKSTGVTLLSGQAGTGKSFIMEEVEKILPNVLKCAFSGRAAQNIGGMTMHKLFNLVFGMIYDPRLTYTEYNRLLRGSMGKRAGQYTNRKRTEVLTVPLLTIIVDEAWNVTADKIDAMDMILRGLRKKPHTPFGGVRMIFSGHDGQLLPVANHEDIKKLKEYGYKYPYNIEEAKVFKDGKCEFAKFILSEVFRQKNKKDAAILGRIENGSQTHIDLDRINQNVTHNPPLGAVILCEYNKEAIALNNWNLNKLPGELITLPERRSGTAKKKTKGKYNLKSQYAPELKLKRDCRVVIKSNGKQKVPEREGGGFITYVNGDTGTFLGIDAHSRLLIQRDDDHEIIKIKRQKSEDYKTTKITVKKTIDGEEEWCDEVHSSTVGYVEQYPISLGYAQTTDSSQGLTMNRVHVVLNEEIDYKHKMETGEERFKRPFSPNKIYVAFSRVKSLDNLTINRPISHHDIWTTKQGERTKDQQHELELE